MPSPAPSTSSLRSFIALPLDDDIKEVLGDLQNQIQCEGIKMSWVRPAQMHVTLQFLGDTPRNKIKKITESLPTWVQNITPIKLQLTQTGFFPDHGSPKVIWVGLKALDHSLKELITAITNGLCAIGLPKEKRPFVPHLTLGRIRNTTKEKILSSRLAAINCPSLTMTSREVQYLRSRLTAQGPIYSEIKTVFLKG